MLAAPDLLLYEVANALRFKREFGEAAVQEAVRSLLDTGVEIFTPTEESLHRTIQLTFRTGLSFYDCLYVALAEQLGAYLITADRAIHKKTESLLRVSMVE